MYSSILVPLDGSKRAEKILPHVIELGKSFGATLSLLGVIEPEASVQTYEPFLTQIDRELYDRQISQVTAYLNHQAAMLNDQGIETKVLVGEGPVVEVIITVAERQEVDLIAMATHGRTGLSRVIYGSVAAGVLHRIEEPLLLVQALDEPQVEPSS